MQPTVIPTVAFSNSFSFVDIFGFWFFWGEEAFRCLSFVCLGLGWHQNYVMKFCVWLLMYQFMTISLAEIKSGLSNGLQRDQL